LATKPGSRLKQNKASLTVGRVYQLKVACERPVAGADVRRGASPRITLVRDWRLYVALELIDQLHIQ